MKIADIMSQKPLTVSPSDGPDVLERLISLGRVRHLPIVADGRLVGMWLSEGDRGLRRVGPEQVFQTSPDARADDAVAALLDDKQVVLAWEGTEPVGVLTRVDVLNVVRAALAQGIGRRYRRPIVVRLVGPVSAGKTALLLRTVPLLRHCTVGVVQADENVEHVEATSRLAGAEVVTAPSAHFRTGLRTALEKLADVQLVLFEDRDTPPGPVRSVGEDHQVLVVSALEVDQIDAESLSEAAALVVTELDSAPGLDLEQLGDSLRAARPGLAVFGVTAALDDRGLLEWRDWLLSRTLAATR